MKDKFRIAAVQLKTFRQARSSTSIDWVPDEPLSGIDPFNTNRLTYSLRDLKSSPTGNFAVVEQSCREIYHRNLEIKIGQVLKFCGSLEIDLVVLPESSVPAELISTLVNFSDRMLIVAGIGFTREQDVQFYNDHDLPAPTRGNNTAVVLGPNIKRIVTKQHAMDGEILESGKGPATFNYRSLQISVAICKDYLRHSQELLSSDIVAIPALSPKYEPFLEEAPRDFLRVFANHSSGGGSFINIPDLDFPVFVNSQGTEPLPRDVEGIVAVDFEGYRKKPSSRSRTTNRLIARAGLIYENYDSDETSLANTLKRFSEKSGASLSKVKKLTEDLTEPTNSSFNHLLTESASFLLAHYNQSLVHYEIDTLSSHLSLKNTLTDTEVRYRQLQAVKETVAPLVTETPEKWANVLAAYSKELRKQAVGVRASFRELRHNVDPTPKTILAGERQNIFAASLGRYGDEAVRSLPRQLTLLRTVADLFDSSISLSYRLYTERTPSGDDMNSHFVITCSAPDSLKDQELERLSEGLGQHIGSVFGGYYQFSGASSESGSSLRTLTEFRLTPEEPLAFGNGWSTTIDYIRSLRTPLAINMSVRETSKEAAEPRILIPESDPDILGDESESRGLSFLNSILRDQKRRSRKLNLSIVLMAEEPAPQSVIISIGRQLFGEQTKFTTSPIRHIDEAQGFNLHVEEAIRLFHPPFGRTYGPATDRPTRLLFPLSYLADDGITLGMADTRMVRTDKPVEVKLGGDDRFRHIFVIGKTGTGKTNLLKNLSKQDLRTRCGMVVIDPHGDLVDYLLEYLPSERVSQTLVLDFSQPDIAPAFNPLILDTNTGGRRQSEIIEEILDVIGKRVFHEYSGPVFEETVRLALETVFDPNYPLFPPSLTDLPRLLRTEAAAKAIKSWFQGKNDELSKRWVEYSKWFNRSSDNNTAYFTSKFADLVSNDILFECVSAEQMQYSVDSIISRSGVLLVKIPQVVLGHRAASFIGSIILSRVQSSLFKRGYQKENAPFYIYVDEFQHFASSGFETLMAEARKFGVGLVLANQNLRQLDAFLAHEGRRSTTLRESILGNVGTLIATGVGAYDAEELAPEFGLSSAKLLSRIDRFEAVARIVFHSKESSAFTLRPSEAVSAGGTRTASQISSKMRKERITFKRTHLLEAAKRREDMLQRIFDQRAFNEFAEWYSSIPAEADEYSASFGLHRPTAYWDTFNDFFKLRLASDFRPRLISKYRKEGSELNPQVAFWDLAREASLTEHSDDPTPSFSLCQQLSMLARSAWGPEAEILVWFKYFRDSKDETRSLAEKRVHTAKMAVRARAAEEGSLK